MSEQKPALAFKLFGVPVRIEPWFFIIPLFALGSRDLQGALIWSVLVFTGVLLHEFGHALAMRACGFQPTITLHALGGLTHFPAGARPTAPQQFFITFSGPGAGLLLGGLALLAQRLVEAPSPALKMALGDAVWINVGWSIINLLPILPWDGGHLLDAGLVWLTGKRRDKVVALFSIVGGGLIVAAALKLGSVLLGYFGAMGIFQGVGRWKPRPAGPQRLPTAEEEAELELRVRTSANPSERAQLAESLAWLRLQRRDFAGAKQAVKAMAPLTPSNSLQARLAASDGDVAEVLRLLSPAGAATEADRPLLLSALLANERFDDAHALAKAHPDLRAAAAARLFEAKAWHQALELYAAERARTGDGLYAYNEACCLSRLGRLEEAVTALQKARLLGYPDLAKLTTDADLEAVRDRPEVRALM